MSFKMVHQDITQMDVDVIVNAANSKLIMGGGVCGAIFKAAGIDALSAACQPLAPISTSQAVITPGFNLKARYIIHTVGPIYQDGQSNEAKQLEMAYLNSMKLALKQECQSMAFPLISAGIYGYPYQQAKQIAIKTIEAFLDQHPLKVYLCLYP